MRHPERPTPGRERPAVQPVPHHRPVLADPAGAAHGPQPSRRGHGRDHRDRHRRRPGTTRYAPTTPPPSPRPCDSTATARPSSASATRCRSGRRARWALSTIGRRAAGSRTSTASSGAKPTSGTRPCTRGSPRSSRPRPRRRATTSPRTSPTRPSPGSSSRSRSCPTSRSSCTSPPARPTPPIMCPPSGSTSTRAASTPAGTRSGRRPSPARSSWASCPPTPSCRPGRREIQAWDDVRRGAQTGAGPPDGGLRRVHGAHRPPRRPAPRRPRASWACSTTPWSI